MLSIFILIWIHFSSSPINYPLHKAEEVQHHHPQHQVEEVQHQHTPHHQAEEVHHQHTPHQVEEVVNYCDVSPALGGSAAETFPPHSYSDYSPKEFFPPAAAPLPHPAPHPCDYSVLSQAHPPGPHAALLPAQF